MKDGMTNGHAVERLGQVADGPLAVSPSRRPARWHARIELVRLAKAKTIDAKAE